MAWTTYSAPQAWYVADRRGGLAVDRLVALADLEPALRRLAPWAGALPRANAARAEKPVLTEAQTWRVRRLYAADLRLVRLAQVAPERG